MNDYLCEYRFGKFIHTDSNSVLGFFCFRSSRRPTQTTPEVSLWDKLGVHCEDEERRNSTDVKPRLSTLPTDLLNLATLQPQVCIPVTSIHDIDRLHFRF